MAVYMLDTDISSYIMKRADDAVLKRLQRVAVSDVCVSAITKAEMMYGVEVSPRRQKDHEALNKFCGTSRFWIFPQWQLSTMRESAPISRYADR